MRVAGEQRVRRRYDHARLPPGAVEHVRSFTRDCSVAQQRVSATRCVGSWRTRDRYRREVIIFLVLLVVTSVLTVAQPLLFRRIVDDGITVGDSRRGDVDSRCCRRRLAFLLAGLGLWSR